MVCPNCGSENVSVQAVEEAHLKTQHRGILYWLFIGWWLEIFLWLFLTIPRLLILLFGHKRQKLVSKTKSICVCQNCGKHWEASAITQFKAAQLNTQPESQPEPPLALEEKYADNPTITQIIKQRRERGESDIEIEMFIDSIA